MKYSTRHFASRQEFWLASAPPHVERVPASGGATEAQIKRAREECERLREAAERRATSTTKE